MNSIDLVCCMGAGIDLAREKELSPRVGAVFPVYQIAEAHEFLERREFTGKIILKWPG